MDAYLEVTLDKIHISNSCEVSLVPCRVSTEILLRLPDADTTALASLMCFFLHTLSLPIISESECSGILCMTNFPAAPLFLTAGAHWISCTVHTLPLVRAAGGGGSVCTCWRTVCTVCVCGGQRLCFSAGDIFPPVCAEWKLPLLSSLLHGCCMSSKLPLLPNSYFRDCLKSLCCRINTQHTGMFRLCHKHICTREWRGLSSYTALFFTSPAALTHLILLIRSLPAPPDRKRCVGAGKRCKRCAAQSLLQDQIQSVAVSSSLVKDMERGIMENMACRDTLVICFRWHI